MNRYLFFFVAVVFIPCNAFAYLDPSSLTMIFQVVVAGIVGALMYFKVGWNQLKYLLTKLKKK